MISKWQVAIRACVHECLRGLRKSVRRVNEMMAVIHAAEITIRKWFVSGHNFSCAERFYLFWALAPEESLLVDIV